MQCKITAFQVTPTSLITRNEPAEQQMTVYYNASSDAKLLLTVERGGRMIADEKRLVVRAGENEVFILLPVAEKEEQAKFTLMNSEGAVLSEYESTWAPPREWTVYIIRSSHTDIGLHNSQYIQRHNSVKFLDKAMRLCDETEPWADSEKYRYVVEGTWWWGNYCQDKGEEATRNLVENYVKKGKIGVGAATAGNHTQVYGHEEMCRSAYTRQWLKNISDVDSKTMTMIDNNGMSWAMVAPYADAGFENIVFAPNQWNPLPSTIWPREVMIEGGAWNPNASGGGSRVDVRYDSALPMVFYWQGADEKSKLLVWGSSQYGQGGLAFDFRAGINGAPNNVARVEYMSAKQLAKLEKRYPYDIWMFACYDDDEEPKTSVNEFIKTWNQKWKWPQFRAVGNLDEPFDYLRKNYDAQIPVLRGDITGGWYQHPVATPELLAQKFAVDRLLPTAEKLSTLAGLFVDGYQYPQTEFQHAWDGLICNDEHSYGTSGYQGRRVYETWLQHRDWIDKAEAVAHDESALALAALAAEIPAEKQSLVLFNPTLQKRVEIIEAENAEGQKGKFLSPEIPPFGYLVVGQDEVQACAEPETETSATPPLIENDFYRIQFAEDGSMASIFDKKLGRELLDEAAPYRCNQFVYTDDNHESFHLPEKAMFTVLRDSLETKVIAVMLEPVSGAEIRQSVTLPNHEKRIDIDNQMLHVRSLINKNRYYRYGYYAFPFAVENADARVQLNGCVATPGVDQTGHGTETYMAAREWCAVENDVFGVALLQQDSQLVEFGQIHPDKTDSFLGRQGSAIYSYLFNDWLQMHTPGGSYVNPRFRYTIVSYIGDYRKAAIPALAERISCPVMDCMIPQQTGKLAGGKMSFLEVDSASLQLIALKRAEDGSGIIARFHESRSSDVNHASLKQSLVPTATMQECTIDEREKKTAFVPDGFSVGKNSYLSLRIAGKNIASRDENKPENNQKTPAPIGSVYTGLVTEPRAVCGEHQGHLYLIWGQNMEQDLSHYELYRSEENGFTPETKTFVAKVEPGEYRVALYEERDLRTHTKYYYRVRAVNRIGKTGEFSNEFCGITRE